MEPNITAQSHSLTQPPGRYFPSVAQPPSAPSPSPPPSIPQHYSSLSTRHPSHPYPHLHPLLPHPQPHTPLPSASITTFHLAVDIVFIRSMLDPLCPQYLSH